MVPDTLVSDTISLNGNDMDLNMIKSQCNNILNSAGEIDNTRKTLLRKKDELSYVWKGGDAGIVGGSIDNVLRELSSIVFELEDIQRDIILAAANSENGV